MEFEGSVVVVSSNIFKQALFYVVIVFIVIH